MPDTFSVLTLQLARAFGVIALAAALFALLKPNRMSAVVADFERSPALVFLGAVFALILGVTLVMIHNLWTDLTAGLVSLLGWLSLIKGALLLAAPEGLLKFAAASVSSPSRVRLWGVVVLVLAAVYLALGLGGHAQASL